MFLAVVVLLSGKIEKEPFAGYYDKVAGAVMHSVTWEEIKSAGVRVSSVVADAPAKVAGVISQANQASKYGHPIDEKSDSKIKQVHASAGGMVLASGWDKELGLYIKIKHEDAVTVYGNLSDIGVVENERIQRGEIIGNYDTESEKEFYYELQENL